MSNLQCALDYDGNLQLLHRSDLFVQSLTNLRQAEEEPSDDRRRSSGILYRHQGDQAFLNSLHSRWNPSTPKPALTTEKHTCKIPGGPNQNRSKKLDAVDEALTALDAYEKHSAKTMEKYYSARERVKQPPAEMAAPKAEQTVSYDASRDPRLRR